MKALLMLLVMATILVGGVAIDLLAAVFNVAQDFIPVATTVFLFTGTLGLVERLRT